MSYFYKLAQIWYLLVKTISKSNVLSLPILQILHRYLSPMLQPGLLQNDIVPMIFVLVINKYQFLGFNNWQISVIIE